MNIGGSVRVYCVDGPCRGVQAIDTYTGRVLCGDDTLARRCVYRVGTGLDAFTLAGQPAAYFDHVLPPGM
jgi:hypothetical protein